MNTPDPSQLPNPRPHGLAIREEFHGPIEDAESFPCHVATHDCPCGLGYHIFVHAAHYDLGRRIQKYAADVLQQIHKNGGPHPDIIQIPMEAEFQN